MHYWRFQLSDPAHAADLLRRAAAGERVDPDAGPGERFVENEVLFAAEISDNI